MLSEHPHGDGPASDMHWSTETGPWCWIKPYHYFFADEDEHSRSRDEGRDLSQHVSVKLKSLCCSCMRGLLKSDITWGRHLKYPPGLERGSQLLPVLKWVRHLHPHRCAVNGCQHVSLSLHVLVILPVPPPALEFKAVLEPKQATFRKSSAAEPFSSSTVTHFADLWDWTGGIWRM